MSTLTFKRKGRGAKKTSTVTVTGASEFRIGDQFTIAGEGIGARGQAISGGRSVDTGRKAKCVSLTVYKVTKTL